MTLFSARCRQVPRSLRVYTVLFLTSCFSLWQATYEYAGAAADAFDIVAQCGRDPVHISDVSGGPGFAMYRSRTAGNITVVSAPEDQPGGIHAVVSYISAMAARHGFY